MATQAQVDALRTAAATGVLEVRFADGRTVKYASPKELLDAAAQMQALIASTDFGRTTLAAFDRTESR